MRGSLRSSELRSKSSLESPKRLLLLYLPEAHHATPAPQPPRLLQASLQANHQRHHLQLLLQILTATRVPTTTIVNLPHNLSTQSIAATIITTIAAVPASQSPVRHHNLLALLHHLPRHRLRLLLRQITIILIFEAKWRRLRGEPRK